MSNNTLSQSSNTDLLKYDRTFYPKETREIRLYGLRGRDEFVIKGAKKSAIRIRMIGGEGEDRIVNDAGRKGFAYDETGGIAIDGHKVKDRTSRQINVNDYNRKGFIYNTSRTPLLFGLTVDDGFWFGAANTRIIQGWRKTPYKSKQTFSFSFAPGTQNAFKVNYKGHYPNLLGPFDFSPKGGFNFPTYENFFGLGNESLNMGREKQFNWVRMQSIEAVPLVSISNKDNSTIFQFWPLLRIL